MHIDWFGSVFAAFLFSLATSSPLGNQGQTHILNARDGHSVQFYVQYCTTFPGDSQLSIIESSLFEAELLARTMNGDRRWGPDIDSNAVFKQWLGPDWNDMTKDEGKFINATLENTRQFWRPDNPLPIVTKVYFLCKDFRDVCNSRTWAYEENANDDRESVHTITLCPKFWDPYYTPTLKDSLTSKENDPDAQKIINNFQFSRGSVMLHETMHMKRTISDPRIEDYSYSAKECQRWANSKLKDQGTKLVMENAESWKLTTMGIFVQKYFKLKSPPIADPDEFVADNATSQNTSLVFNDTSPGLKAILPTGDTDPTTKGWQEIHIPSSGWTPDSSSPNNDQSQGKPACSGSKTSKWVPRDPLNTSIQTFCADAEKQGIHDKDSGSISRSYLDNNDRVSLGIDWPVSS